MNTSNEETKDQVNARDERRLLIEQLIQKFYKQRMDHEQLYKKSKETFFKDIGEARLQKDFSKIMNHFYHEGKFKEAMAFIYGATIGATIGQFVNEDITNEALEQAAIKVNEQINELNQEVT